MARLSPSPSGSSCRLSELLEEQQQPFSLHLYLLDKGCSPTRVDASSTCWPRSRHTTPALKRMVARRNTRASSILGLLLSKILRCTTATAAAAKKGKKLQPAAAIDWGSLNGEKSPGNLKNAVLSSPLRAVEADEDEAEDEEEDDDDDESLEQSSPVSVLEQRPFEEQAPPAYAKRAMVIIRDLLDAANNPALLDQLLDNKFQDGRNHTSSTTPAALTPAPTRTDRPTSGAAHWEEMFEAELAKVHDLIASDMAGARVGPGYVRSGRWDVGAELAVAVLEALTEEIAVELMGIHEP